MTGAVGNSGADAYVWLIWSSVFLLPWSVLFATFPAHRRFMWRASLFTAPFGLTEPLFVPEYWNPPSLFQLAQRTGFDVESLIFTFGIAGVGAVLYNICTGKEPRALDAGARRLPRHRFHLLTLTTPVLIFLLLIALRWNPIYSSIAAMGTGAFLAVICRPDLARKTWIGGVLFLAYYSIFLFGLEMTAPGYIARTWNLGALSGVVWLRVPLEEFLFAIVFGMYWSGVYEHLAWMAPAPRAPAHHSVS
jgi:hypothetical protein